MKTFRKHGEVVVILSLVEAQEISDLLDATYGDDSLRQGAFTDIGFRGEATNLIGRIRPRKAIRNSNYLKGE